MSPSFTGEVNAKVKRKRIGCKQSYPSQMLVPAFSDTCPPSSPAFSNLYAIIAVGWVTILASPTKKCTKAAFLFTKVGFYPLYNKPEVRFFA